MNLKQLIAEAVRIGKESVLAEAYEPHKERGALAGFDKCLTLESIEDFESEIARCRDEEHRLRDEESLDAFWEQRMFTSQIEHVYKLLCVAAKVNKWPGSERLPDPYYSGILLYSRIVGTEAVQ